MLSDKVDNNNQTYLKINAKTWGRDSHGLFDYESVQVKTNNLFISINCRVIRRKNDVKQVPDNMDTDLEERELCRAIHEGSKQNFNFRQL
jgi:hypothetical protein